MRGMVHNKGTMNAIIAELNSLTIGHTKVIGSKAVTRWSADKWEVGTFGRKIQDAATAAQEIIAP
jgi:hypothetical protein